MATTQIEALANRIGTARRLTILTGAGVSAASGVPTCRGSQGLWRQPRPEDLATVAAFRRDPLLVWEWYASRRAVVAACEPNPAHHAIARLSRRDGCAVVTQNVDELHLRAGTQGLVRLHGSLWEMRCLGDQEGIDCGPAWRDERVPLPDMPPRGPSCGGLARPAVVWFGERLADEDVAAAERAADCDLFLTVGTSAVVHPAAGLVGAARRHGAWTVEINPELTPATRRVDMAIQAPAEAVLAKVERLLAGRSP